MENLTDADIRRPLQRAELTSLDNGDGIVVEDISDSKVKYIKRENLNPLASKVEITDAGGRYTATDAENALQEIAGDGRTTETVKGNADDIATLDGRMDTAESDIDSLEDRTLILENEMDAVEGELVSIDESLGEPNGIATLDATGKIPSSQLPVSAMEYKGAWDASTGSYPTSPDTGDYWSISVAGTIGGEEYDVGDAIVYNGTSWDKLNKVEIAQEVSYDNSESGLSATNVQDAIDENAGAIDAVKGTGWTDENLVDHETRIETLETNDTIQDATIGTLKESLLTTKLAVNELERQSQIGNGATLDFEDIGTVALDARATGRANPTVDGLTATNLVENGSYDNTSGISTSGTSISVTDNILTVTSLSGASPSLIIQEINFPVSVGDKLFIAVRMRVLSGISVGSLACVFDGTVSGTNQNVVYVVPTLGQWCEGKSVITVPSDFAGNPVLKMFISGASISAGDSFQVDGNFGTRSVNLTATFGAGNEPSASDCAKIFSYFDGTKSIQLPARVRSVGKNLFDGKLELGSVSTVDGSLSADATRIRSKNYTKVKPSTGYVLKDFTNSANPLFIIEYDSNKNFVTATGASSLIQRIFTATATTKYIKFRRDNITNILSDIQLSLGSTATTYEPYQDSTLYIADDEEVRSVPAVKDQVKVMNGEVVKVQNVQRYVLQASDVESVITLSDTYVDLVRTVLLFENISYDQIGKLYLPSSFGVLQPYRDAESNIGGFNVVSGKIDFLISKTKYTDYATEGYATRLEYAKADLAGTVIYYQLAEPITTPLTTSGILKAFQNGTVYYEPYYEGSHQTDASSQITLPYEGTIEAVYGYDENYDEYEVTDYSLTGTTLTITGALENEVFYVQMERSEPLAPEMSVNVINNAEVAEDSVTGKFYKKTFTVANGVPTFGIEEVV